MSIRIITFAILLLAPVHVYGNMTPRPPVLENPPTHQEIVRSIGDAVHFLLTTQNRDGSWGSARRTKQLNIYAPVPSGLQAFHAGTTSLALSSLLETLAMADSPDSPLTFSDLRVNRALLVEAVDRGEDWLENYLPKLRRSSSDALYNIWGHAYGIRTLVRMIERFPDDTARVKRLTDQIQVQIGLLDRFQALAGGWCYYDFDHRTQRNGGAASCFMAATVLLALEEAQKYDVDMPQRMIDRAIASIIRQRKPDFSFLYGEYLWMQPMRGINVPAGSLARSQSCNLALTKWGDTAATPEVFEEWLDRLFARNWWLCGSRKRPIPHEFYFQIAGYFYYYGHFYAAFCIDQLPEVDRPRYRTLLAATLMAVQDGDGSFWDYPLYDYHQQYGTGYAIMTLLRTL